MHNIPRLHTKEIRIISIIMTKKLPLVLGGHVTNASFKTMSWNLADAKNWRNAIWEETHLREIFYGTLTFQQSSMICTGRHVGEHTLALQHGGQSYFCLYLVERLIVTLRCAVNVTTSSFQHFPRRLSAKCVVKKEVIHNFKKITFWSRDHDQLRTYSF